MAAHSHELETGVTGFERAGIISKITHAGPCYIFLLLKLQFLSCVTDVTKCSEYFNLSVKIAYKIIPLGAKCNLFIYLFMREREYQNITLAHAILTELRIPCLSPMFYPLNHLLDCYHFYVMVII